MLLIVILFSAAITTRDLIGFFIYFACYLPVVFLVPMHKLRRYLYPCCIMTAITFFGILGWTIKKNGGTGPIVSSTVHLTGRQRAFTWLQCASSTAAVWGGSGDRLSDWTRFGKSKHSSTPALLFGLVLAITPTAIVGVLVTSAFRQMYQTQIWTPLGMLLYIQNIEYTPSCRAATFFAGVGLLANQIYINIVQNTMAFGMDACGLMPRYMSIKRAAVLLSMISIACNPWRFLSQASIFIEAMSVFAVFATATTAILISDYFVIRKRAWKIPDLYHEDGIYWYFKGFNLRAITAWILAVIPSLRKS
jgi:NCS1 family nucleobase:cation symporter-1